MRKGIIYVYFNKAKYEKEGIEKYYVGQTVGTMKQRAGKDGRRYNWDNPDCNNKFANSIRKWGWDAFEGRVLEEVYEEDLNELEKFYIEQFDSYENGYNSTIGGEGIIGLSHNEESKKMISEAGKKRYEDEKEREKTSLANKKRFQDPTEREKISTTIKKHYEDPTEREKMSKAQKKRYENEEERKKTSEAVKTSWENPERKKIQSKKLSGENNGVSKYHKVIINNKIIIGRYLDETINISKQYIDNINRNWFRKSAGIPKKFKNIVSIEEISKEDYYILLQNKNIISYVNDCK